jgi:protease PrsW
MLKFYSITGLIFIAIITLINIVFKGPWNKKTEQALVNVEFYTALQEGVEDSLNVEYHYNKILKHFEKPAIQRNSVYIVNRDDEKVERYYKLYTLSEDSACNDIGNFCLGLCQSFRESYSFAGEYFSRIHNREMKHLNGELGYVYMQQGDPYTAQKLFKKELTTEKNSRVYKNLITAYYRLRDFDGLDGVYKSVPQYFSASIESDLNFAKGRLLAYSGSVFHIYWDGIGLAGASLVLLTWIFYLIRLNTYTPTRWNLLVISLLGGMAFSFFTPLIYDYERLFWNFHLTGNPLKDFLFSVAGIGAGEELIKIIPFLLLLPLIKEPIDYIILASASALGFAFIENLIYLKMYGIDIIHGRGYIAVLGHMIDTSMIAYALMLAKFHNRSRIIYFLSGFGMATLSHGFYDFWLLNDSVNVFYLFSYLWMLVSVLIWIIFINNALNNSLSFIPEKSLNSTELRNYVFISLVSILAFEYGALAYNHGSEKANEALMLTMLTAVILIAFLTYNLANMDVVRGQWIPLYRYDLYSKLRFLPYLKRRVSFLKMQISNTGLQEISAEGIILSRKFHEGSDDFFMVGLLKPLDVAGNELQYFLIRAKNRKEFDNFEIKADVQLYTYKLEGDKVERLGSAIIKIN